VRSPHGLVSLSMVCDEEIARCSWSSPPSGESIGSAKEGQTARSRLSFDPQDQGPADRRAAGVQPPAGGACVRWWTRRSAIWRRLVVAPLVGLLYCVRDVFRAAGALVCLGRWLHRAASAPTRQPKPPAGRGDLAGRSARRLCLAAPAVTG
jgi:hypothetical protein